MIQATETRSQTPQSQTEVTFHYHVAMSQPQSHLLDITLEIRNWTASHLDLTFPVWTPGSYLVREYAKQIQELTAKNDSGTPLIWQKQSKNQWRIQTKNQHHLSISYRLFANELTVRTNHFDDTHAYFNGAATFFYSPGLEHYPIEVTIHPHHPDWQIATTLPAVNNKPNCFYAADFDTLVDNPFEVGIQERRSFEVLGKPHELVVWGQGNLNLDRLVQDTKRIIELEANLFDGLPYDRYLFLLHLSAGGFGGLEHKTCCSLNYPRLAFQNRDRYRRFMQLVAHEFFHLWNVKRIRPKALEHFDYEAENYTPSLWFCEGATSYYDMLIPLWSKIYGGKAFLKIFSKDVTRFYNTPGRLVQPLSESSWDAWIKLYRRDANSDNSQISYYLKGEMVALMLDLTIRRNSQNTRSLTDVLRQLWDEFGKPEIGYSPQQLQAAFETAAGQDLSEFFQRYIHGTEELPLNEYLEPFGLRIKTDEAKQPPFLGVRVSDDRGITLVDFVEAGSPAAEVGLEPGDELLAINRLRVTADGFGDRLQDFDAGDEIELSFFHQDELKMMRLSLTEPRPANYTVATVDNPTPEQAQNFQAWLGVEMTSLKSNH